MFPVEMPASLRQINPDYYYTPYQIAYLAEWPYGPDYVYKFYLFKKRWTKFPGSRFRFMKGEYIIDAILEFYANQLE